MKFTKSKKIASLVVASAIMATGGITAFAASNGPSLVATDAKPDFSNVQKGEMTAVGTVDPETITGGLTTKTRSDEAGLASLVEADVDMSNIDFSNVWEGELTAIGTVDPETITGGPTTKTRSK